MNLNKIKEVNNTEKYYGFIRLILFNAGTISIGVSLNAVKLEIGTLFVGVVFLVFSAGWVFLKFLNGDYD